jgi:SET domain-containing protein
MATDCCDCRDGGADGDRYGGFLIKAEVRYIDEVKGHGVFALEAVPAGTLIWTPRLVTRHTEAEARNILFHSGLSREEAQTWLRHTFVLATDLDHVCSNVTDIGRFSNHSTTPTGIYASEERPSVAARDINVGDELTVDYSGLGSPDWYRALCRELDVISTDEVVRMYS